MRLTPAQVQAFANLAFKYENVKAATISRGDGRTIFVKFDGGATYRIGGRGVVTEV